MKQRILIKDPTIQDKIMQGERASFNTHALTEKDQGKIASLAFALYEERGREDGHDLDDWLEAEQRIVRRGEGRGF